MGGACCTHGVKEKFIEGFVGNLEQESTWTKWE